MVTKKKVAQHSLEIQDDLEIVSLKGLLFTESAPRPLQPISCDVCGCVICRLSPLFNFLLEMDQGF